jgi:hypothetical protein
MRRAFRDDVLETAFRETGSVVVDLLDTGQVAELTAVYAAVAHRHWEGISASILSPDHAYRREVHDAVASVLASPLLQHLDTYDLAHAGFVVKSPATELSAMGLHQDISIVDEPQCSSVTVWCPLVDVGPENGWLGVVDGSHRIHEEPRGPGPFPYAALASLIEERHLRYVPLRAGQALLMHPATFHASPPNLTADVRVVAAAMAAPAEAQLVYCHRDFRDPAAAVEVYAVGDDFYKQHRIGTRPEDAVLTRTFVPALPPLAPADLGSLVAAGIAT